MQSNSEQRKGNRYTLNFSEGSGLTSSYELVNSTFKTLAVVTDTVGRPANRSQNHPQEYYKSSGHNVWEGFVNTSWSTGFTQVTGQQGYVYNHVFGIPTGFSSEVYNQCLSKINEAIRGDLDLAVDLAEGGQTVGMRRQLVKTVVAILHFRRTFGEATFRDIPNTASEAWLAWQYGIRPLLNSCYGIAGNLRKSAESCLVITKRANARAVRNDSRNPNFLSGQFGPVEKFTEWSSQRCEIKYVVQLDATVLQRLGDWTSLNPVSIAWELVPYSFVADWFIDVGGYLRNMESAFLYRNAFKGGYVTQTFKAGAMNNVLCSGKSLIDGKFYAYSLMASKLVSGKQRSVLTNVAWAHPPTFKVRLGWQRLASAASLITSWRMRSASTVNKALSMESKAMDVFLAKLDRSNQYDTPQINDRAVKPLYKQPGKIPSKKSNSSAWTAIRDGLPSRKR